MTRRMGASRRSTFTHPLPSLFSVFCRYDHPCDTWSATVETRVIWGIKFRRIAREEIIFCDSLGTQLCFNLGKEDVQELKSDRLNVRG
jgi:hypothetical protein